MVSKQDKLVGCHHGEKLFSRYLCPNKTLKYIESDHNQHRSALTIKELLATIDGWRSDRESQLSLSGLRRMKTAEEQEFAKLCGEGRKSNPLPLPGYKISLAELKSKDCRIKASSSRRK